MQKGFIWPVAPPPSERELETYEWLRKLKSGTLMGKHAKD